MMPITYIVMSLIETDGANRSTTKANHRERHSSWRAPSCLGNKKLSSLSGTADLLLLLCLLPPTGHLLLIRRRQWGLVVFFVALHQKLIMEPRIEMSSHPPATRAAIHQQRQTAYLNGRQAPFASAITTLYSQMDHVWTTK